MVGYWTEAMTKTIHFMYAILWWRDVGDYDADVADGGNDGIDGIYWYKYILLIYHIDGIYDVDDGKINGDGDHGSDVAMVIMGMVLTRVILLVMFMLLVIIGELGDGDT